MCAFFYGGYRRFAASKRQVSDIRQLSTLTVRTAFVHGGLSPWRISRQASKEMSFACRTIKASDVHLTLRQSSIVLIGTGFLQINEPPDITKSQFLKDTPKIFFFRLAAIMLVLVPEKTQLENTTFPIDEVPPSLPQVKLSTAYLTVGTRTRKRSIC